MKAFIAINLIVLCTLHAIAQPALNRVYGDETGNGGYTVIPEANGYFIAGDGYSNQFESGDDLWAAVKLYRVDSMGNMLWEKEFGDSAQAYETGEGGSAKTTDDGGYIIPGKIRDSATGNYIGLVIRIDSNGDSIWKRTFGLGTFTFLDDCVETSDKGLQSWDRLMV